jgi:hypothetical protein
MEEAPANGKKSSNSAHADGMNEWMNDNLFHMYEWKWLRSDLKAEEKWIYSIQWMIRKVQKETPNCV